MADELMAGVGDFNEICVRCGDVRGHHVWVADADGLMVLLCLAAASKSVDLRQDDVFLPSGRVLARL